MKLSIGLFMEKGLKINSKFWTNKTIVLSVLERNSVFLKFGISNLIISFI